MNDMTGQDERVALIRRVEEAPEHCALTGHFNVGFITAADRAVLLASLRSAPVGLSEEEQELLEWLRTRWLPARPALRVTLGNISVEALLAIIDRLSQSAGVGVPAGYRLAPVEPGDKQLKIFGYAPGQYMTKCMGCGQTKDGLDKRASSCRDCAERRYRRVILECAEDVSAVPAPPAGVGERVDAVLRERGYPHPMTAAWLASHLDHYQRVIDSYSDLKSAQAATPAPSPMTEEEAVRVVCNTANIHRECSYPMCKCMKSNEYRDAVALIAGKLAKPPPMMDREIEAVARIIWNIGPKCDLRNVSAGPCGLDDECLCWPHVLDTARAVISHLRQAGAVNSSMGDGR